jgi:hypothetical protein
MKIHVDAFTKSEIHTDSKVINCLEYLDICFNVLIRLLKIPSYIVVYHFVYYGYLERCYLKSAL